MKGFAEVVLKELEMTFATFQIKNFELKLRLAKRLMLINIK